MIDRDNGSNCPTVCTADTERCGGSSGTLKDAAVCVMDKVEKGRDGS